jgi:molybdopterin-containing oxidoreductase family membrane subunit
MYSLLSFGWTGRAKHWNRFELVSLVLAGVATPLVFSVHSIVSFDFATSVIPGWHTTIFPPYFVAGAVFSGFAMVQTLMLVMRKAMKLEAYIHTRHVEYMNIVIMVTGSIVGVAYLTELFVSWYSGVEYEAYAFINRATGPYWWAYFSMMTCNVVSPQLMWFRKLRRSLLFTFIISIVVNIGMWFERFVIIVTSVHRDYLPSSWSMFYPTHIDIGVFVGTIGLFFVFFLLFARFFPVLALNEVKSILRSSGESFKDGKAHSPAYSLEDQHLASVGASHDEPEVKEVPKADDTKVNDAEEADKTDVKAELFNVIGESSEDKKDDLKKINGLGPVMETKLNEIGIYSYAQLAKMTNVEYNLLDEITGTMPGRAEKDDWAGQAKELMNNNDNN